MKTITNIKDLDNTDLSKEYKAYIRRIGEEFSIPDDEYDFGLQLGGDIHIVESIEDYNEMVNTMGPLDYADYIGQSQDPRYWTLLFCTNNAGGPSYLVPHAIAAQHVITA